MRKIMQKHMHKVTIDPTRKPVILPYEADMDADADACIHSVREN